jgi:PPM family protein phosphatase
VYFAGYTDKGLAREHDEDSFLLCCEREIIKSTGKNNFEVSLAAKKPILACVADGMGGHAGGEVASRLVCDCFAEAFPVLSAQITAANIEFAIRKTVTRCLDAMTDRQIATPALQGMGATLVGFIQVAQNIAIFHTGDSRAYGLNGKFLRPLTTDHNEYNKMLSLGVDLGDGGRGLIHCLGGGLRDDFVEITFLPENHNYSAIFLCSDGVSEFCDEDILEESIATRDLKRIQANIFENGAGDNLTYVAIYFDLGSEA